MGTRIKVFKRREVVKLEAEGNKLRKRPRITITHVKYQEPGIVCNAVMFFEAGHYNESNEFYPVKTYIKEKVSK